MIIFNLKTKNCMQHLLLKTTFDSFSLIEGEITTYNTFHIDGYLHKKFFEDAPQKEYSSWGDLREFCFQIIRGKRTPLNFRFILSLPREDFEDFLNQQEISAFRSSDLQGLYLNFKYDGTSLKCVTGTSLSLFTMDKTLEKVWDNYAKEFFLKQEIDFD
ncbi:hypothetical protein C818_00814 [Lachnospiraceae bacterium MD308]|jgi:hypothetical protein|nr:hypothetical protein C818_00814 [Lachnospiraceae bacterium MD308]MCI8504030.1 hypothetical protein [Dorea sp.]